jgi:outer membrane biosynthesis protein TonB
MKYLKALEIKGLSVGKLNPNRKNQIAQLNEIYAQLETLDPESDEAKNLKEQADKLDYEIEKYIMTSTRKSEKPPKPPVKENEINIAQHIEELKKEAKVQPEKMPEPEPETEPETEETKIEAKAPTVQNNHVEEEFANQGQPIKKKSNMPLILMGVGAFLLTMGAVNFFKDRR